MERKWIDLRSDTVTQPSEGMRQAMANAEVGDDVFGEDPTINALQERCTELTGHEAALFMPTGSMANEVAIKLHTHPGDEVLTEENSHINNYELSAMAVFSGVLAKTIPSEKGWLTREQVEAAMRGDSYFLPRPGLIMLENTHNMKGGTVYPQDVAEDVIAFANERGIPIHLDGARIANASAATGVPIVNLTKNFDSAMFTFSKGLGAPAGSMLVGSRAFISEARVVRKRMGGGMRQIGILAAACDYALDHNLDRLGEDHANAKLLADSLNEIEGIDVVPPETNIIVFDLADLSAQELSEKLHAEGILTIPIGQKKMRLVTHLDVSCEDVKYTIDAVHRILS